MDEDELDYEVRTETKKLGMVDRAGNFQPDTINEETRTVTISWGTGAPVTRHTWLDGSYVESLEMDKKSIRMGRMNSGNANLFADHYTSVRNILAVINKSWVKDGEAFSEVRFSKNPEVEPIWQDVRDGIIKNASIGYRIHKVERKESKDGNKLDTVRVTDWEPHELSLVGVGADAGAGVRSEDQNEMNDVEFTSYVAKDDTANRGDEDSTSTPTEKRKLVMDEEQLKAQEAQRKADLEAATVKATADAKDRTIAIRELCSAHKVSDEQRNTWSDGELSLDDVRSAVLDYKLTEQNKEKPVEGNRGTTIEFHGENIESAVRGIADVITGRVLASKGIDHTLSDNADEFKGMGSSIVGAARYLHGQQDGDHAKWAAATPSQVIQRALNGSDHFPILLAAVANKSLEAFYTEIPGTWAPLVDTKNVSDFKDYKMVTLGENADLKLINEQGEYKKSSLNEKQETINALTYGRTIGFSRQMLINDDMDGMAGVPQAFAASVARLESDLFWNLVISNPTMNEDSKAVFHADHGNLGTAGVISKTSLSEARKSGRLQRGIAQRDGSESLARLNIQHRYLIVGPDLETNAIEQLGAVTPEQIASINQFTGKYVVITEPRLDDYDAGGGAGKAWFLATDPSAQAGRIKVAYLDGNRAPFFDSRALFENDGVEFKVRHDVGFAFSDFRGWFRNDGA